MPSLTTPAGLEPSALVLAMSPPVLLCIAEAQAAVAALTQLGDDAPPAAGSSLTPEAIARVKDRLAENGKAAAEHFGTAARIGLGVAALVPNDAPEVVRSVAADVASAALRAESCARVLTIDRLAERFSHVTDRVLQPTATLFDELSNRLAELSANVNEEDFSQAVPVALGWWSEERRHALAQLDRRLTETAELLAAFDGSAPRAAREKVLGEALEELDSLVGMEEIKHEVRLLADRLAVDRKRRDAGLKTSRPTLHMVFSGGPGTGKTTVARIVGRILHGLGYLREGQLVEVARPQLVAGYVGQTAGRTNEVIDSAVGGVLFIDEAYSLVSDRLAGDFGSEALEVVLKRMEDDRDEFVLIAAGYPKEMKEFTDSNPGLASRFGETLLFPDYSPDELVAILDAMVAAADYEMTLDARAEASSHLADAWCERDDTFGNGRLVRNYLEDAIAAHAHRLAGVDSPTTEQLRLLTSEDLRSAHA